MQYDNAIGSHGNGPVLQKQVAKYGHIGTTCQPHTERLQLQPVSVQFYNACIDIDNFELGSQQPDTPGRHGVGSFIGIQPGVDCEIAIGRYHAEYKADKNNQIKVI